MVCKKIIVLLLAFLLVMPCVGVSAIDSRNNVLNFNKENTGYFKWNGEQITYNNLKETKFPNDISTESVFENGIISFDYSAEKALNFGVKFRASKTGWYWLKFDSRVNKALLYITAGESQNALIKSASCNLGERKTHKVEIKLLGRDFLICIDGKEIIKHKDSYLSEGNVGFTTTRGNITISNINVDVDRNTVYESYPSVYEEKNIYIATDGDDQKGDGSYERPYKSLEKAISKIGSYISRLYKVNVVFKEGEYRISEHLSIDKKGSGLKMLPVTYMAEEGKKVTFNGSKILNNRDFKIVTDTEILRRMYPEVVGKVYEIDLQKQGIARENIDWVSSRDEPGENNAEDGGPNYTKVFINDRKQYLSRWPNDAPKVIEGASVGGTNKTATIFGTIRFSNEEPYRWSEAKDMYVGGNMNREWYQEWVKVKNVDLENLVINMATESQYGFKADGVASYKAYNLLEEIDVPGEYYIDFASMKMYIYLDKPLTEEDKVEITTSNESFIAIKDAENIEIKGLNFEKNMARTSFLHPANLSASDGPAIWIGNNSKNVSIKDCKFKYIGSYGVYFQQYNQNATNVNLLIEGCDFYDCHRYAVVVGGGNIDTLETFGCTIRNNFFVGSGVGIGSSDAQYEDVDVINNTFSNVPGRTITAGLRLNDILYNELSRCSHDYSDMGVIYAGRNLAGSESKWSYNLIHHYGREEDVNYQFAATYLDDHMGGVEVSHNIFHAIQKNEHATGIIESGGPDCKVYGNISVNAGDGYYFQNRAGGIKNASEGQLAMTQAPYEVVAKSEAFVNKYPEIKRYKAFFAEDFTYDAQKYNVENLAFNCIRPVTWNRYDLEPILTGVWEEPINIDDEDIFVDPEHMDYRITNEAKEKYNLPNSLLSEDFDINLIGVQREVELNDKLTEFRITMPTNNEIAPYYNKVKLSWEYNELADRYEYEISEDEKFENIVVSGASKSCGAVISSLKADTDYYLRVRAINYLRTMGFEKYSTNNVIHFKTSSETYLFDRPLKEVIEKMENELIPSVVEGNEPGNYKVGILETLKEICNEAKSFIQKANLTQEEINTKTLEINDFIATLPIYRVASYIPLPFENLAVWNSNKIVDTLKVDDQHVIIEATTNPTVSLEKIISNLSVVRFKMKVTNFTEGYFTLGLGLQDTNLEFYMDDSYYVLFKKDIVEVQKKGEIFETFENKYITDEEWHDIAIGVLPTNVGVNIYLEVDGVVVVDYVDTNTKASELKDGRFAMRVPKGAKIELAPTDKKDSEVFNYTQETAEMIKNGVSEILDTNHTSVVKEGSWSKTDYQGNKGVTELSSNGAGNSILWQLKGEGLATYKVYYWNNPSAENDKKATVSVSNIMGQYYKEIDLTQGEEGWVEIGTFKFVSNDAAIGEAYVKFTGSGNGKLPMSAIRMHKVDSSEYIDMLTEK